MRNVRKQDVVSLCTAPRWAIPLVDHIAPKRGHLRGSVDDTRAVYEQLLRFHAEGRVRIGYRANGQEREALAALRDAGVKKPWLANLGDWLREITLNGDFPGYYALAPWIQIEVLDTRHLQTLFSGIGFRHHQVTPGMGALFEHAGLGRTRPILFLHVAVRLEGFTALWDSRTEFDTT